MTSNSNCASVPLIAALFFSGVWTCIAQVSISAQRDTTIYSENSAINNGAGVGVFVGRNSGGNLRRTLISFDIAGAVPAGATITSVSLSMSVTKSQLTSESISLRKISSDWGEGSTVGAGGGGGQGVSATAGSATWGSRLSGSATWATAGGDFSSTVTASSTASSSGTVTWSSAQMASDVQNWLNSPSSNFGWILIGDESSSQSVKRLGSRQDSTSSERPVLTVSFTAVPEPTAIVPAILLTGWAGFRCRRRDRSHRGGSRHLE